MPDSDTGRDAVQLDTSTIEAIAQRVVELLAAGASQPSGLLTAEEVAQRFGVSRAWVYENSARLGAVRIGEGQRPRLRFEPDTVARCFAAPPARRSTGFDPPREHQVGNGDLIPVRGL